MKRGASASRPAGYEVEAFYALRGTDRVAGTAAPLPGDRLFSTQRVAGGTSISKDEKNGGSCCSRSGQEPTNPPCRTASTARSNGVERFWQVSNAGIREHFLVYVSPTRLVELESHWPQSARRAGCRSTGPLPRSAVGVLRSVGGLTTAQLLPSTPTFLSGLAPRRRPWQPASGRARFRSRILEGCSFPVDA